MFVKQQTLIEVVYKCVCAFVHACVRVRKCVGACMCSCVYAFGCVFMNACASACLCNLQVVLSYYLKFGFHSFELQHLYFISCFHGLALPRVHNNRDGGEHLTLDTASKS